MARRADGPARRGHVLVVANPKGGVGKSTLSVNLACALAASGARVAIVDNDEQGSAAAWAAGGRLPVPCLHLPLARAEEAAPWVEALERLRGRYELVLIDAPAAAAPAMAAALLMASLVLVPLAPSELEVSATYRMGRHLRQVRAERPDNPPEVLVVPTRVAAGSPPLGRLAEPLAALRPDVAPPLRYRREYQEAFARRLWVGAHRPGSAAHREVLALARVVRARLAARSPSAWPGPTDPGPGGAVAGAPAFVRSGAAIAAAKVAGAGLGGGPGRAGHCDGATTAGLPAAEPAALRVIYLDEEGAVRGLLGRLFRILAPLAARLGWRG
jgi:chromosome partitioning protein